MDALADAVRAAVAMRDPELPVMDVRTLETAVSDSLGPARLAVVLLSAFAVTALGLSGVGLFAVLASSVAQRTREVGLRVALGARPRDVFTVFVGEGLRDAAAGVAIGLAGSVAAARLLPRLLDGIPAAGALPAVESAALLVLVAFVACALPARRAMRLSPAEALRTE